VGADAVFVVGFVPHLAGLLQALRDGGYQGNIASTTTATLPEIVALPAAEGVFVAAPAIYNPNYVFALEVKSRFEKTYRKPFDQYAANGFDLIHLLVGLLEDRDISSQSLKTVLDLGFVYSGLFGNVECQPGGHDIQFPLLPARIHDAKLEYR